jgi:di/tricarboxylate transporter
MTIDAWLTVAIIAVLFGLLIWDRWPTWSVFAGALAAVLTLDLAPEDQVLAGFANSGVLSVVVLYVVAAGMYRTGAISLIIDRLLGVPASESAANRKLLPVTATGSAFLNNTPIVAMLIPVIADLGTSARLAVSRIYMAVSNASILGGAATLIGTSTNLIIAGLAVAQYGDELEIFFPTRIGLPAAVVGLLFLLVVGNRLISHRTAEDDAAAMTVTMYRADFRVGDRLAGRTVGRAGLAAPAGATLLAIRRNGDVLFDPTPETSLAEGDVLEYEASIGAVGNLWTRMGLTAATPPGAPTGNEYAHRLAEVVVAENSSAVGRQLHEIRGGERKIVALARHGTDRTRPIADETVRPGDLAILEVESEWLDAPHDDELLLVTEHAGYRVQRADRAVIATVIVAAMVLLSAFGVMSLLNAALLASVALIASGCLSFQAAWRSIDWQTYVVLAAAVGLEPAVTDSGLAEVLADALGAIAGDSLILSLAVVYAGSILLTNLVTNAAAAALMFPIMAGMVTALDTPWQPFVAVLMLGCSYAFINPAGYQTSLMVMKPGGYKFVDFVRVGVPLTVVVGAVAIPLAALLY